MALITIEKDGLELIIPGGAYEKMYAPNGWTKVGAKEAEEQKASEKEKDEWDEIDEELDLEKSVDEMSMDELKAKAKELKIDISKLTTVGAIKKAIKNKMK